MYQVEYKILLNDETTIVLTESFLQKFLFVGFEREEINNKDVILFL